MIKRTMEKEQVELFVMYIKDLVAFKDFIKQQYPDIFKHYENYVDIKQEEEAIQLLEQIFSGRTQK